MDNDGRYPLRKNPTQNCQKRSLEDGTSGNEKPKHRKTNKLKDRANSTGDLRSSIPIDNQFSILEGDDHMPNQPSLTPKTSRQHNIQPKKPKPVVMRSSIEEVRNTLQALNIKCVSNKIRNTSTFQIFTNNIEEKKKLTDRLKEHSIQFHTYSEPQDRHEIFILKGHHRVELDALLKELQEAGLKATSAAFAFDPLKKRAFAPGHPRPQHYDMPDPVYRVFFEKGSTTFSQLQQKHRYIDYFKVSWEKANKSRARTQCHRCQLWSHSSVNCNRPHRCIKCLNSHDVGQCARTTTEGDPSCVNCGKSGHISSSYECEAYKRYAARTASRGERQQQRNQQQRHQLQTEPAPALAGTFSGDNGSQAPAKHHSSNPSRNVSAQTFANTLINQTSSRVERPSGSPSGNIFAVFEEFNQIPDIQVTLRLFSELVQKLKSAQSQSAKIGLLLKYSGITS